MAYAFRCRNCNSLADSAHAGERAVPAKCSTCGAGVRFSPDGIKTYDEDNWLVLADASDHELAQVFKFHAIGPDDVEVHVPTVPADPDHVPVDLSAEAADSTPSHEDHAR